MQTLSVMQNYETAEMIKRSKPESCIERSSLEDLHQSQLAKAADRQKRIVGKHPAMKHIPNTHHQVMRISEML